VVMMEAGQMLVVIPEEYAAAASHTALRAAGHIWADSGRVLGGRHVGGRVGGRPTARIRRIHEEVVKIAEAGDGATGGVHRAVVIQEKVHGAAGEAHGCAN